MVTTSRHIRIGYEGGRSTGWLDITIWSYDGDTDTYVVEVDGQQVYADQDQLRALAMLILEITQ